MQKVVTVTLNPCFDVTLAVDFLRPEAVARVAEERVQAAGKGVNVGKVLRSFKTPVLMAGFGGSDNLSRYLSLLGADAGELCFLPLPGSIRENLTVIAGRDTYKINRPGFRADRGAFGRLEKAVLEQVLPGDIVAVCGSLPMGIEPLWVADFLKALGESGCKTALDCDYMTKELLSLCRPWLMKPNLPELERLVGRRLSEDEAVRAAGRELCALGVGVVLASLGEKGILAITEAEDILVPAPHVEVESTVGAGDAALAGFLEAFLSGDSLRDCAEWAAACGSDTVTRPGTGLAAKSSAQRLLDQIRDNWRRVQD